MTIPGAAVHSAAPFALPLRNWNNDRIGLRDDDASKSWNSSHPSRRPDGGCSQNDFKTTGDGLMYCFAAN
jgi:hypothetical protein